MKSACNVLAAFPLGFETLKNRVFSSEYPFKVEATMLRQLEEGKFMVEEVCSPDVLQRISEKLKHMQSSMKNQRTAVLWTALGPLAVLLVALH